MTTYRERLIEEGRDFQEVVYYSLDAKGRFVFPTAFRDEFADGLFVAQGLDRCLDVWTREGYGQQKLMAARLPVGSREARQMRRVVMSVHQLDMDGQHRVTLPKKLRREMGLDREITIVGNLDHLEIWDRSVYRAYMDEATTSLSTFDSELDL
ncbi:MAG TPA: hypothetical protein VJ978_02665 [Nitriliruptoraceae bacterium]|nr:hypothetical protein [Nitriliruptoraceae bacterium]